MRKHGAAGGVPTKAGCESGVDMSGSGETGC